MNEEMLQYYMETSVYTDVGIYKEFILSLPDDIPSLGMLVCDQITHPSMYFTEPSSYLEDAYYGKFSAYPKSRFKNEDELWMWTVIMSMNSVLGTASLTCRAESLLRLRRRGLV